VAVPAGQAQETSDQGRQKVPWTEELIEFVEKAALLRETIKRRGDNEHYDARIERMSQKLEALAASLEATDASAAAAIRSAWNRPVRSLAFRNAAHSKERE
jgi:hypothetical protein